MCCPESLGEGLAASWWLAAPSHQLPLSPSQLQRASSPKGFWTLPWLISVHYTPHSADQQMQSTCFNTNPNPTFLITSTTASGSKSVVLTWEWLRLPRDVWQCLQTFFIATTVGVPVAFVNRGRRCHTMFYKAQDIPHNKAWASPKCQVFIWATTIYYLADFSTCLLTRFLPASSVPSSASHPYKMFTGSKHTIQLSKAPHHISNQIRNSGLASKATWVSL